MMVQFTSTGTLDGGPQTYRWSEDGGTTWSTGTTAGRTMTLNGVNRNHGQRYGGYRCRCEPGPRLEQRYSCVYQAHGHVSGRRQRPPAIHDDYGRPRKPCYICRWRLWRQCAGTHGQRCRFVLNGYVRSIIRIAQTADQRGFRPPPQPTVQTSCACWFPVGYGYGCNDRGEQYRYSRNTNISAPSPRDLNLEIMKDSYISVNNVGKDIFGGYYEGKPALDPSTNLFDMVGEFISYCENNNPGRLPKKPSLKLPAFSRMFLRRQPVWVDWKIGCPPPRTSSAFKR